LSALKLQENNSTEFTEHTLFGTQVLLAGSLLTPIPSKKCLTETGVSTNDMDTENRRIENIPARAACFEHQKSQCLLY
jgi:hypothetical protein